MNESQIIAAAYKDLGPNIYQTKPTVPYVLPWGKTLTVFFKDI